MEFGPGLNVLTGETGAGKSVLVGALALIAGARTDRAAIRSGARRASVEGLFEPARASEVSAWLREHGLAGEDDAEQVLVHREIAASGTGRILVNGAPCTLALLRELGPALLELHGQHEHRGLLEAERHLDLLDRFAGLEDERRELGRRAREVTDARTRERTLRDEAAGIEGRRAELQAVLRDVDAVRPQVGELEELARQRAILRSAGRVAELLDQVIGLTYEGETTAGSLAAAAASRTEELAALDPGLADLARRLRETALELEDVGSTIRDYRERADFDPSRLERIEERRVALERICQRYAEDEEGLLRLRDETSEALDGLAGLDRELARAAAEREGCEKAYARAAIALSGRRRSAAGPLGEAVETELGQLALEKARFDVDFAPASDSVVAGERGEPVPLSLQGAERAEFLLAANPGEPFRPLRQVASGGELSRVLLSLHGIAERPDSGCVLVFDEVDAGVGGAVADAVGVRLKALGSRHQVLCVTHLAQVAAHAQLHYRVSKATRRGRTHASAERLVGPDRIEELARMVGGKKPTQASRRHAAELIASADARSLGRTRRRA